MCYSISLMTCENQHAASTATRHLSLLIGYMDNTFKSTSQRMATLLKHREITYDLLWALFKPNTLTFTKCAGTGKPQCLSYNFGEEKKLPTGEIYFSLQSRYLNFDGKTFGETTTELHIFKFRGTRRIQNLSCYPIQFHSNKYEIIAELENCGRKFVSMISGKHQYCRGIAYYWHKDRMVQVSVDSRVMVDPVFFRKMNPNHRRPRIIDGQKETSLHSFTEEDTDSDTGSDTATGSRGEMQNLTRDELVICSSTIPGFSFNDKRWCKGLSCDSYPLALISYSN